MRKWSPDAARAVAWVAMLVVTVLAVPAAADVYAWRTDDGVFAYTDDPSRIPARYADGAVRVEDTQLGSYARLTRPDSTAAREEAARAEKRLEYLRRLNALDGAPAPSAGAGARTVTISTGNSAAPLMDVQVDGGSEPVVVERVLTKADGQSITRHSTIVRQGDRTLAIIKGRSRDINASRDVYDEDELAGR